ncbi:TniQ family protein [Herminiimonas sp. NPDC097707]|uniref:TniQ family protein n=1 Tax=Herminiimonas sp. NPDC097707 TaxID=3364007 RepID=UPI00383BC6F3
MLIATPIPQADESPSSVLMRAAALNGLGKVRELVKFKNKQGDEPLRAGITSAWRSPELYAAYMAELGITLPHSAGAYRQLKTIECTRVYFNDHVYLPSLMYRPEGSAFCPQCLAEKPYLRRIWSLKILDVCPTHRCDLIVFCPVCDQAPNWDRQSPEICHCKFDLRTCQPSYKNKTNPDEVVKAIQEKCQISLNLMVKGAFQKESRRQRENRAASIHRY